MHIFQPEIDVDLVNKDPVNGDQSYTRRELTKRGSHRRIINVQESRREVVVDFELSYACLSVRKMMAAA